MQERVMIDTITVEAIQELCGWNEDDGWSDENLKKFREYIKLHNIYYYARPAESFDQKEAIEFAIRHKFSAICLENLS